LIIVVLDNEARDEVSWNSDAVWLSEREFTQTV